MPRCALCDATIATSVEVARMDYAHADDVGALALHGRRSVHRWC